MVSIRVWARKPLEFHFAIVRKSHMSQGGSWWPDIRTTNGGGRFARRALDPRLRPTRHSIEPVSARPSVEYVFVRVAVDRLTEERDIRRPGICLPSEQHLGI